MGSAWLPATKEDLQEYHMLSGKPRKTLETQFDEKFFQIMLDDKYKKWIRWDKAGTSVIIPDEQAFEQNVLPHFMRSTSFNSVVRQLSNYKWDRKCQISKDGVKGHIISYPGLRRDYPQLWKKVRLLPPPILQTTPASNKSRSGQFKALASHLQEAKNASVVKDQVIGKLQERILELERYRQQSGTEVNGTSRALRDGPSRRRLKRSPAVSEVEEKEHATRGKDKRNRPLPDPEARELGTVD
ncbi:hypothetical protein BCR39DRAFT_512801 [Naematelia encephala]|uniref:HSF-type DNA-binding domain-containing protein n=1 Tax=Naematelia encephala TaxID=71784 RepID=A0A1Y2BMB8_9TREE|nr:hypothetical protein BCR39DRAFT_512801 [Naematelia encephala]